MDHKDYMELAIGEALKGKGNDEVPIGAVLVLDNQIIGRGHNRREETGLVTSHCEIEALNEGARAVGTYRLREAILYVTLEPCPMCLGAIIQSEIKLLVYGGREKKMGAVESYMKISEFPNGNRLESIGGILEEECLELLRNFFKSKR